MTAPTGKLADPEWRHERAVRASAAAHTLDTYVRRVEARGAELTAAQRGRLALLLHGANADQSELVEMLTAQVRTVAAMPELTTAHRLSLAGELLRGSVGGR